MLPIPWNNPFHKVSDLAGKTLGAVLTRYIGQVVQAAGDICTRSAKTCNPNPGDVSGMNFPMPKLTAPVVNITAKSGDIKGAYEQLTAALSDKVVPPAVKAVIVETAKNFTEKDENKKLLEAKPTEFANGLIAERGKNDQIKKTMADNKIDFDTLKPLVQGMVVREAPRLAAVAGVTMSEQAKKQQMPRRVGRDC